MTCDKSIGPIDMAPIDLITDLRDYFQNNYFEFISYSDDRTTELLMSAVNLYRAC